MAFKKWANLRGERGPAGPGNRLSPRNVVAGEKAAATISGDAPNQFLDLVLPRGEQGLPGANAVPSDEAVAGYLGTLGTSESKKALYGVLDKETDRTQTDYVSVIAARSRTDRLFVRKSGIGVDAAFEVTAAGADSHVTATFNGIATGDKYRRIWETWAGTLTQAYSNDQAYVHSDLNRTGTWQEADGAAAYTTQVGAAFRINLVLGHASNAVAIRTYRDNRGGLWRLTLTGNGRTLTVTDSTWIGTPGYSQRTLFSGLDAGSYVLRGEFIGDDPAHAPNGGISRGWLTYVDVSGTNSNRNVVVGLKGTPTASRDTLVAPVSNWDFAIQSRPVGAATAEWVPEHNNVTNSVLAEPPRMFNGGRPFDLDAMAQNEVAMIEGDFELVQHIYGRHTATGTQNNLEVWTSHVFHPDGRITITGRWRALVDLVVSDAYVCMLPVTGGIFDKLVTSFRNQYANPTNGTYETLTAEGQLANSYAFISSTKPDLAVAVRYDNPAETMRRRMPGKPDGSSTAQRAAFIDHGDATKSKLYQQLFLTGTTIPAGTVHRFSGEYARASAPGLGIYLAL